MRSDLYRTVIYTHHQSPTRLEKGRGKVGLTRVVQRTFFKVAATPPPQAVECHGQAKVSAGSSRRAGESASLSEYSEPGLRILALLFSGEAFGFLHFVHL
jgi:hypothetical protein